MVSSPPKRYVVSEPGQPRRGLENEDVQLNSLLSKARVVPFSTSKVSAAAISACLAIDSALSTAARNNYSCRIKKNSSICSRSLKEIIQNICTDIYIVLTSIKKPIVI